MGCQALPVQGQNNGERDKPKQAILKNPNATHNESGQKGIIRW